MAQRTAHGNGVSLDVAGVGALGLVAAEWLLLGWLSGARFPPACGRAGDQSTRDAERAAAAWVVVEQAAIWAVRLLVGASLLAAAQLVLALVGIGFRFVPAVLLLAAAGAGALRLLFRALCGTNSDPEPEAASMSLQRGEAVGWLLLGAILIAALVRSLLVPESGWDAYSHWGLRAQAFAEAGTIVNAHSEHEYYPPLVPLLEAWLYLHRGQVSIDLAKTVWALVGSAFAVSLGWQVRTSLRPSLTWLAPYAAAGILLGTNQLLEGFWTGQADLALTAYLCLATLAVWQWSRTSDSASQNSWLIVVGIFGAATALTKFEGLPRLGLLAVALVAEAALARDLKRVWLPLLSLLAPALIAWLLWTEFQLSHAIPANAEHIGNFQPLAVGGVLLALVSVFAGVRTGGGLLISLAAWILSSGKLFKPPLRFLVLVVAAQAFGTLFAFLVSTPSPEAEVLTSATRLVEQFLPIALLVGVLGLARTGHL